MGSTDQHILEHSKRDTSLLIGITDAQADRLLSLARKRISKIEELRVQELEAEVSALQGLVCYLLEKNEYLRIRLQAS